MNGPFKYCLDLINTATYYYDNCLWDYCSAAQNLNESMNLALCNSIDALSRECSNNFVDVEWRNSSFCRNMIKLKKTNLIF